MPHRSYAGATGLAFSMTVEAWRMYNIIRRESDRDNSV